MLVTRFVEYCFVIDFISSGLYFFKLILLQQPRCWPLLEPNPTQHKLWLTAESLGAQCSLQYDPGTTTHVVTQSAGTDKARAAQQAGKLVVTPAWLECCRLRSQRVEEAAFPAAGGGGGGASSKAPE